MIASDVMTRNPEYVQPTDTVRTVIERMRSLDVRHLPVLDKDGMLAGILSDRDIKTFAATALEEGRTLSFDAPVSSIMSSDVISVGRDADLTEVVDIFIENKIGAIPVVDEREGRLVGIVSYIDVLRAVRDMIA